VPLTPPALMMPVAMINMLVVARSRR